MVALLLQAKADAAAVNEDKESAVALAAKHGHEEVVTSLLDAGVSVSQSSSHFRGVSTPPLNFNTLIAMFALPSPSSSPLTPRSGPFPPLLLPQGLLFSNPASPL